jgi:hypothetical protein
MLAATRLTGQNRQLSISLPSRASSDASRPGD